MRNTVKLLLCVFLSVGMLLSCVSCAQVQASELSGGYTRNQTGEAVMSEKFKTVMADFSWELFQRTLTEDAKNDLISPLSAMMCLALVANGADGETLAQIEQGIGMDIETLNESLYAHVAWLSDSEDCKLRQANSIWFRDDGSLEVEEEFLQTNADWYGAQVYGAPFDNSTVKDINNWGKKQTDGMIDSIIDKLDPTTLMVLINALVFDAKWQEEYEKSDIRERAFQSADGKRTLVEMLHSEESTLLEGDDFIGFAKNYKGGAYSFVGLLPNEGTDVYTLAASLDGEEWCDMWNARHYATIHAGIPEFTYEAEADLKPVLKAMGMTDMFDGSLADFSSLGHSPLGNIYCEYIQQKTMIDVSRHGTKAAAITWGGFGAESEGPEEIYYIILDRPFLYAIVDNASGLPIFLGAVTVL